jgi:ATP-dependent Clp protease ATP-binding subunit ClpA
LNRIDEIVLFDILSPEAIRNIVNIEIDKVKTRLADKEISLELASEVIEYLAKEGYDPHYGARPLRRLIQNKILTPMASLIISAGVNKGATVTVSVKSLVKPSTKSSTKSSPKKKHDVSSVETSLPVSVVKDSVEFVFDVKKGKVVKKSE